MDTDETQIRKEMPCGLLGQSGSLITNLDPYTNWISQNLCFICAHLWLTEKKVFTLLLAFSRVPPCAAIDMSDNKSRSAWFWVPSLYFSQGIPYVIVMTMSVVMYK